MSDHLCSHCDERPAVCIGKYDNMQEEALACDECCGHGNEDGRCEMLGIALTEARSRIRALETLAREALTDIKALVFPIFAHYRADEVKGADPGSSLGMYGRALERIARARSALSPAGDAEAEGVTSNPGEHGQGMVTIAKGGDR